MLISKTIINIIKNKILTKKTIVFLKIFEVYKPYSLYFG